MNRPMTSDEERLVRWMLEHGKPEAREFLAQLEFATVTPWKCGCGCASFHLSIAGGPPPSPGIHPIADFISGDEGDLSGIFVYEQQGTLGGVEVYGMAGDAPKSLPTPEMLRPFS